MGRDGPIPKSFSPLPLNTQTDGWIDSDYLVAVQSTERTNKLQLQLQQCGNIINYATNVQIKHKIPKHLKCSNNQCAHCAQLFEDMRQ